MRKFVYVLLLGAAISPVVSGCTTSGSREYIPGRGWVRTYPNP